MLCRRVRILFLSFGRLCSPVTLFVVPNNAARDLGRWRQIDGLGDGLDGDLIGVGKVPQSVRPRNFNHILKPRSSRPVTAFNTLVVYQFNGCVLNFCLLIFCQSNYF